MNSAGEAAVRLMRRIDSNKREPKEVFESGISIMESARDDSECLDAFLRFIKPETTYFMSKNESKQAIYEATSNEYPILHDPITIVDGFGFTTMFPVHKANDKVGVVLAFMYVESGEDDLFVASRLGMVYNPGGPGGELDARSFLTPPDRFEIIVRNEGVLVSFDYKNLSDEIKIASMRDVAVHFANAFDKIAYLQKNSDNEIFKQITFDTLEDYQG